MSVIRFIELKLRQSRKSRNGNHMISKGRAEMVRFQINSPELSN